MLQDSRFDSVGARTGRVTDRLAREICAWAWQRGEPYRLRKLAWLSTLSSAQGYVAAHIRN
eukprot:1361208-Pyramimonas_sp.AAC.1